MGSESGSRTRYNEFQRQQIIDATKRLMLDGDDPLTVERIVDGSGVARASFYRLLPGGVPAAVQLCGRQLAQQACEAFGEAVAKMGEKRRVAAHLNAGISAAIRSVALDPWYSQLQASRPAASQNLILDRQDPDGLVKRLSRLIRDATESQRPGFGFTAEAQAEIAAWLAVQPLVWTTHPEQVVEGSHDYFSTPLGVNAVVASYLRDLSISRTAVVGQPAFIDHS